MSELGLLRKCEAAGSNQSPVCATTPEKSISTSLYISEATCTSFVNWTLNTTSDSSFACSVLCTAHINPHILTLTSCLVLPLPSLLTRLFSTIYSTPGTNQNSKPRSLSAHTSHLAKIVSTFFFYRR